MNDLAVPDSACVINQYVNVWEYPCNDCTITRQWWQSGAACQSMGAAKHDL